MFFVVELVDGTAPNEGNVMINGRHVCDENWNKEEAMVVCQMLGYASGEETTGSEFESVKDNNFIATNFFCDGSEQNLIECNLKANHLCSGDEAAGVRCSTKLYGMLSSTFMSFVKMDYMYPSSILMSLTLDKGR